MGFDDIKPRYGKFYDLVETVGSGFFHEERRFSGIYIGKNPNITPWFLRNDSPEGYIFVARSEDGGVKVYCQRTDKLKETWLSEGEDGPEWPIGIEVEVLERMLKESERGYLSQIIDRKLIEVAA